MITASLMIKDSVSTYQYQLTSDVAGYWPEHMEDLTQNIVWAALAHQEGSAALAATEDYEEGTEDE